MINMFIFAYACYETHAYLSTILCKGGYNGTRFKINNNCNL